MNRRGVIEEFLFQGVLVEPGDGARPLGDGGPGPAADFQVTGKAFDVRAARLEQAQVVLLHQFAYWRRSRAYASWVKPVYPAQNPGQRQVSEHRLGDGDRGGHGRCGGGHRLSPGSG